MTKSFIQCDKELAEMKNQFISESQYLTFQVSSYMEYNQRFSYQREELFSNFLEEFGRITDENNSLKIEKGRMNKEVGL